MVLRRDFADLLDLRVPLQRTETLIQAMKRIAKFCPDSRVYLGLDCSLAGLDGCRSLRHALNPMDTKLITAPQFPVPEQYGLRTGKKLIGVYSLK